MKKEKKFKKALKKALRVQAMGMHGKDPDFDKILKKELKKYSKCLVFDLVRYYI